MNLKEKIRNVHLRLYTEAAQELGIGFEIIEPKSIVRYNKAGKQWSILRAVVPINDSVASNLSRSKQLTNKVLNKYDIPVPEQWAFKDVNEAVHVFEANKGAIVIKPNKGIGGKGITINPRTKRQFIRAFKYAQSENGIVLLERYIHGRHFRIMVLDTEILGVVERVPAYIRGNGRDTIEDLIFFENQVRENIGLKSICIDEELESFLEKQDLTLNSVVREGEQLFLRQNCNLSTGGITLDVTSDIHPMNAQFAIDATKHLGLKFSGVDMIAEDIGSPINYSSGAINEVNHNPGLRPHYMIREGKPQKVAIPIQQFIFDNI